ncbi:NAD(P)/FAD-dependent oxidoreductase [Hyphococcus luteus]|uniref:Thioredoxin reductase n=1 Tax=Hyphococcus luteus TaxID=2058213 RepID=A0A2S7KAM1_9PROT|nr:FAD-dependent oxidoreductase [Marinicaulis flavus]PQA89537.1 thioredoxin-disulfide reductase [Marinicaulis flavus]
MSDEYDVVVVGGGLAGMSAGLTSARLGRKTAILTGGLPGGQLVSIEHIDGVPGFPEGVPGYDLCPMTQEQCDAAGVAFLQDACDGLEADGDKWRLATASGPVSAGAVIVASGSSFAKLGAPGEEEFQGRGVSDCASCDGPLLRGKTTLVVGGGDSAMQEALALAEHVEKVIMIERGAALNGQAAYKEKVEASDKIELQFGKTVSEILGDDNGVAGVKVKDAASGDEVEVKTAAVFVFAGLVPNSAFLKDAVPLDEKGRIVTDASMRTSAKGVLAAGAVRAASACRAAGAMGDGAGAALAADHYLATGEWPALS